MVSRAVARRRAGSSSLVYDREVGAAAHNWRSHSPELLRDIYTLVQRTNVMLTLNEGFSAAMAELIDQVVAGLHGQKSDEIEWM